MPPKRLIRDYWPAVLHRARKDTTDFFGLSRKSLTVLATIPIGFGVGALILGPQAMLEEFLSLVSFTFAPIGILAFAIYLRNLFRAPWQLAREEATAATIREDGLSQTVTELRAQIEELEAEPQPSFHVEPRPAEISQAMHRGRDIEAVLGWKGEMPKNEIYAQLAVRVEGGSLKKCYVRLKSIEQVASAGTSPPFGAPARLLHWSSREEAYGDHQQWLDIPDDGAERIADIAVAMIGADHWRIVAADPGDRTRFEYGWYKIVLTVASDSDEPRAKEVELILDYHERLTAPEIPPPITLRDWEPTGEQVLAKFRANPREEP